MFWLLVQICYLWSSQKIKVKRPLLLPPCLMSEKTPVFFTLYYSDGTVSLHFSVLMKCITSAVIFNCLGDADILYLEIISASHSTNTGKGKTACFYIFYMGNLKSFRVQFSKQSLLFWCDVATSNLLQI